ncbi:MAG: hypothetical protein KBA86_00220 [Bacteroidales bacterium]|nr:hypothetical protein [Bacteroidales bacterium]
MKNYIVNNFKAINSQYTVGQLSIGIDLEGCSLKAMMFEKYPSISPYTYCANNPVMFVDPTGKEWDLSGLTESQKKTWESTMAFACKYSKSFNKMYNQLNKSSTVYKVAVDTKINTKGEFNAKNNTVAFNSEESIKQGDVYIEELFHAYQKDNADLYESGKSFNKEFEAKVAKLIIKSEMGSPIMNFKNTNMEGMANYLFDNETYKFCFPDELESKEFNDKYMKEAENFKKWNIENNYGDSHYRTLTNQSPKSLLKLFGK